MKRLILFLLMLNSVFAGAQIPPSEGPEFYGTRHFISLDGADTLSLSMPGDTIFVHSTDSVFIDKFLNKATGGVTDHGELTGLGDSADHPWALEWNDTISTIATRYWTNTNYLGINDKAADADKLDNLESSQFMRSDVDDNASGIIRFNNDVGLGRFFNPEYENMFGGFKGFNTSLYKGIPIEEEPLGCQFSLEQAEGVGQQTLFFGFNNSNSNATFGISHSSNSGASWTTDLIVTGQGRTGIGTATPSEKLEVNGNILMSGNKVATEAWVTDTAKAADADKLDGINSSQFLRSDVDDVMYGNLRLSKSTGDVELRLKSGGVDGNMSLLRFQNSIDDGNFSGGISCIRRGGTAHDLVFYTWGQSERMRILNGGNVGIGTTTPTEALDVNGNILASGEVTADNINTTVQSLSGTTVTWNASSGHHAKITLSGNTTITMSNLVAGTTGNLTVTNPSTAYDITFSGYTILISPMLGASGDTIEMSGASEKDVLSWYYDGTQVFINGTFSYE